MKKFYKISLCLVLFLVISQRAYPQEEKIQALYIYNFTKYMQWQDASTVNIGVLGNTSAIIELETITKRSAGKLQVIKLAGDENITKCQIIFIPTAQSRNFAVIQAAIGDLPIIIVTEDQSLIDEGAEIAFYREDNKLRFILNKEAIDACGVKVSASLISMAKMVNN